MQISIQKRYYVLGKLMVTLMRSYVDKRCCKNRNWPYNNRVFLHGKKANRVKIHVSGPESCKFTRQPEGIV